MYFKWDFLQRQSKTPRLDFCFISTRWVIIGDGKQTEPTMKRTQRKEKQQKAGAVIRAEAT